MNKVVRNNLIFIFTFILLCTGVFFLNRYKDPYNIKNAIQNNCLDFHSLSPDLYYTTINLSKNKKYDYIIIGSSAAHLFKFVDFLAKENKNIAILSLPMVSSIEQYEVLKYFLDLHPEVKKVLVSLEYEVYIQCFTEPRIKNKSKNILSDIIRLYFSIDATKKSLNIIFDELGKYFSAFNQAQALDNWHNSEPLYTYNEKRFYNYSLDVCDYTGLANFKKIYNLLTLRNIKAVYFIPPCHADYLSIAYLNNKYPAIGNFKREVAKITPFYDMGYLNYYTLKPLKYFFIDAFHVNCHILGKRIFNILLKNELDKNLTVYITKDNADTILDKQRNDLINYVNENKTRLVEFEKKYKYIKDISPYIIPVYPEDIKNTILEKYYLENNPDFSF